MAYNPQIEYRGDQYLFNAVANLGESVGKGIQQYRASRDESKFLDEQAQTLAVLAAPRIASGALTKDVLDDLAKVPSMSLAQKRGKIKGLEFLLNDADKQMQAQAEQSRHNEEMGIKRANVELQRGNLMVGQVREERRRADEQRQNQDTLGMLLGLSGQESMPSPVDPANPGPYLRGQYPNADARVLESLIRDNSPTARARLEIDRGNLEVAREQVENRRAQIANEATRVDRKTLTPTALAAFTKAKGDLRMMMMAEQNPEKQAAIQADIDRIDAMLEQGSPPPSTNAPAKASAKRYNPQTRKLE